MIALIGVGAVLLVGAYFLVTSKAPKPLEADAPPADDAKRLVEMVIERLRERLPGYEVSADPEHPLQIVATETGSERKLTLGLQQLAPAWYRLVSAGKQGEADELVEDFVSGATGEGAGSEQTLDVESARQGLAIALVPEGKAPKHALTKPAGTLTAMLVLRHPAGFDVLEKDDLDNLGIALDQAYSQAFSNLRADVEEGLPLEIVDGDEKAPRVVQVAPGDPLAASYALVPELAGRLEKRLGAKEIRFHLVSSEHLFAAAPGTRIEEVVEIEGEPLVKGESAPAQLAWNGGK